MKKILLLAALAVAFMACENKEEMPKNEQKAMNAATVEVFDQIGVANQAAVDKLLTKVGFVQIPEDKLTIDAKVKAQAKAKLPKAIKEEDDAVEVVYVYGLPKNWEDMSAAELEKYMQDQLANEGNGYITVTAVFSGKYLTMTYTTLMTAIREKVNASYVKESDALFAALPKPMSYQGEEMKYWGGAIGNKTFEDRAEYIATVAAAQEIEAQEQGYSISSYTEEGVTGVSYQAVWMNPDEETKQEMIEYMGVACAYGMFFVADVASQM